MHGAVGVVDDCINVHGNDHYQQSRFYIPGPDLCRLCQCDSGHNGVKQRQSCKAVLCSPPIDCRSSSGHNAAGQQECCDYICLDHVVMTNKASGGGGGGGGGVGISGGAVHTAAGGNNGMQAIDKFGGGPAGGHGGVHGSAVGGGGGGVPVDGGV